MYPDIVLTMFPVAQPWRLRPIGIRVRGLGLPGAKIVRIDRRIDKILRRYGRPSKPTQHCELSGMSHRVGEWALKESFLRGATQFRSGLKVPA